MPSWASTSSPRQKGEDGGDKVFAELRKLAASQRRVEGVLMLIKSEQQQVNETLVSLRKDVAEFADLSLRGGRAAGAISHANSPASETPADKDGDPHAGEAVVRRRTSDREPRLGEAVLRRRSSRNSAFKTLGSVEEGAEEGQDSGGDLTNLHHEAVVVPRESSQVISALPSMASSGLLSHMVSMPTSFARAESEPCNPGTKSGASDDSFDGTFVAPLLPLSWPSTVSMRQDLEDYSPIRSSARGSLGQVLNKQSSLMLGANSSGSHGTHTRALSYIFSSWTDDESGSGVMKCIMIHPSSAIRTVLDILTCLVLVYDITVNPVLMAWDLELGGVLYGFALASCLFWTVDLATHFITGYHTRGHLEMTPKKVVERYSRTWFLPDLVMCVADWLSLPFMFGVYRSKTAVQALRFFKLGRLFRVLGKFRMMKFVRIIEDLVEGSMSELPRTCFRILLMLSATLWLNHLIACAWFAVGRVADADTGMRWVHDVKELGGVSMDFLEANAGFQYATAFHWSLAQLASGEIEISCFNTAERWFNIVCLVIGLLFSSCFVSSLSASMVDMQMRMRETRSKLMKLRRFLRENDVDRRVALRAQQQAADRLARKQRLLEKDVTAIELLSSSLRSQLRFEVCKPHLVRHPLFRLWTSMDQNLVQTICVDAVEICVFRQQDELFIAGTFTHKAYHIVSGTVSYTQDPQSAPVEEVENATTGEGTWLAEASLWSHWTHVGTAEAISLLQVLIISAEGLCKALRRSPSLQEIGADYCRQYHRRIVSATPPDAPWPSDLQVPFTEYADLVHAMHKETRMVVSLNAMEQITAGQGASWTWRLGRIPSGLENLRSEVQAGKSVVLVNGNGQLERVVSVVALRMENSDGLIFCQIGKLEPNGALAEASCQLPGGKQESGEVVGDSLQRVLQAKLPSFATSLEIKGVTRHVQWKMSREHGIKTKYLRTECSARLLGRIGRVMIPIEANKVLMAEEVPAFRSALLSRTVYAASERGLEVLYSWISPHELTHMSGQAGEADLNWWLGVLSLNCEDLPARRATAVAL